MFPNIIAIDVAKGAPIIPILFIRKNVRIIFSAATKTKIADLIILFSFASRILEHTPFEAVTVEGIIIIKAINQAVSASLPIRLPTQQVIKFYPNNANPESAAPTIINCTRPTLVDRSTKSSFEQLLYTIEVILGKKTDPSAVGN